MKQEMKFLLKVLCFLAPVAIALAAELFLPGNFFTFRCWEAATVADKRAAFGGGCFYPGMDIEMEEQGDLAPYTEHAVKKRVRWVTDRYGYRTTERGDQPYPVVIIGDSMLAGSGLSQEDILSETLARALAAPVYPFGPAKTVNDYIAEQRFLRRRPSVVVLESVERDIPKLPEIRPVCPPAPRPLLAGLPQGERLLMLHDRLQKQAMYNYLKTRVFGVKSRVRGKVYESDPEMFFFEGKDAIRDVSPEEIDRIAGRIADYKAYFDSLGIHFVFLPIPNKETVYYRLLPSWPRPVFLDKLTAELRARNIDVVDTPRAFREAYEKGRLHLYQTDDSHWNEKGVALTAELLRGRVGPFLRKTGRNGSML